MTTAQTALQALSDIDLSYIADAAQAPVRRIRPRVLIAAVACAAVLCAVGGVFAFCKPSEPPLITSCALYEDADAPLVTEYSTLIDPCYASPRGGDVLIFFELEQALSHYENEDVRFWVAMTVFPEEGCLNFDEAATDAECARLATLGYELYTYKRDWIGYWGEDKHYTTVCLKMSADELRSFETVAADARLGYAFDFAHDLAVSDGTRFETP